MAEVVIGSDEQVLQHFLSQWIGVDGFYGQASGLLYTLDAEGDVFMADIHTNQSIYLSDPAPCLPAV